MQLMSGGLHTNTSGKYVSDDRLTLAEQKAIIG